MNLWGNTRYGTSARRDSSEGNHRGTTSLFEATTQPSPIPASRNDRFHVFQTAPPKSSVSNCSVDHALGLSTGARTDETAPRATDAQALREHFFVLRAWYLNECSTVAIHRVHKASAELSSQSISARRYSDAGAQIPKATRSDPFLRRQENDRDRSDSRRYRERHTG